MRQHKIKSQIMKNIETPNTQQQQHTQKHKPAYNQHKIFVLKQYKTNTHNNSNN